LVKVDTTGTQSPSVSASSLQTVAPPEVIEKSSANQLRSWNASSVANRSRSLMFWPANGASLT
jgi:hypothetical protein